ncbi:hypothetical protein ACH44C_09820 [Streptomyces purpureus]|uniref:hypothetical protein n=1 Tax=Streptomyces purpureus TaxID=1951 RepID=UPI0037A1BCE3
MTPRRTAASAVLLAVTALAACTEEERQQAVDVVASATAAAASKMAEVTDGIDAKGDVKAGPARADGDRTTAEITATNPAASTADYTIAVNFRDDGGGLLDTVVVTIDDVPAGQSKTGTARSNRTLSGATTADIGQALRH